MFPMPELGWIITIALSWMAGALCVLLLVLFRINPQEDDMFDDRLRDDDGKPLYVPFRTPIMMPLDMLLDIKRRRAIEWLGTRWTLHPEHKEARHE
jgi:hypothetical protein